MSTELTLYMQNFSYEQIAEMTNQSLGLVRSKIRAQEKQAKAQEAK